MKTNATFPLYIFDSLCRKVKKSLFIIGKTEVVVLYTGPAWAHVVRACLSHNFLLPVQIMNTIGGFTPGAYIIRYTTNYTTLQFHFWEYLFQIFGTLSMQCTRNLPIKYYNCIIHWSRSGQRFMCVSLCASGDREQNLAY
jgi:hypothetical protein